jgi:hypothetical protein
MQLMLPEEDEVSSQVKHQFSFDDFDLTPLQRFRVSVRRVMQGIRLYRKLDAGVLEVKPHVRKFLMRFSDDKAEEKFSELHIVEHNGRARTTLAAMFWLNNLFVMQDFLQTQNSEGASFFALLIVRVLVISPALAMGWSCARWLPRRPICMQMLLTMFLLIAAAGYAYHLYLLPQLVRESAFTNVLRLAFLLPTTFGLQFRYTVLPSLLIVFLLPLAAAFLKQNSPGITYYTPHLVVQLFFGSFTCFSLERDWKNQFFYNERSLFPRPSQNTRWYLSGHRQIL